MVAGNENLMALELADHGKRICHLAHGKVTDDIHGVLGCYCLIPSFHDLLIHLRDILEGSPRICNDILMAYVNIASPEDCHSATVAPLRALHE